MDLTVMESTTSEYKPSFKKEVRYPEDSKQFRDNLLILHF